MIHSFSLTRTVCVTISMGLTNGSRKVMRGYISVITTLPPCESFSKLQSSREGWGPLNPSPIHDVLLTVLVLYRSSVGNHHACQFITAMTVSFPEDRTLSLTVVSMTCLELSHQRLFSCSPLSYWEPLHSLLFSAKKDFSDYCWWQPYGYKQTWLEDS